MCAWTGEHFSIRQRKLAEPRIRTPHIHAGNWLDYNHNSRMILVSLQTSGLGKLGLNDES